MGKPEICLQTARWRKRVWLGAFAALLLAAATWFLWTAIARQDRRSADERLAAIEAARAIPDSENAALIYSELLQDPNAADVLSDCPAEVEKPPIFFRICHEPWLAENDPPLAGWIKKHQGIIDGLLAASKLEKCRFPISIDMFMLTSEVDRAKAMRHWGFLLAIAANNDLADGRSEQAIAKWQCLLQTGSHLRQQPVVLDHLLAKGVTRMALEPMARLIVAGDTTESGLQRIETLRLSMEDDRAAQIAAVRSIEDLRVLKMKESSGLGGRLGYSVASFLMKQTDDSRLEDGIKECRCSVRGIQILIALKRYKIATGHWPRSLDEIKPSFFQGTLTDPINGGPFVYRPAGSTFVLYSKGKNNIDDHGKRDLDTSVDDWPIWPPRGPTPDPKPPDANGV